MGKYINLLITLFISAMLFLLAGSCRDSAKKESEMRTETISTEPEAPSFFGDSVLTIISSNKPNGYSVKFFQTKDLTLINLSRGDSINQYIALHEIPQAVWWNSFSDLTFGDKPLVTGTYIREIDIPVEDYLSRGLFFMDVNFDGEEELVIEHPGYNRSYYACFDVAHGVPNVTPGILQAMDEEPYNLFVCGDEDTDTEFDAKKKTIHITEKTSYCSSVEIWCEMVRVLGYKKPKLRVVRQEERYYSSEGHVLKTVYKRIDGELKEVSKTFEKL